jgi:hypothetical protein
VSDDAEKLYRSAVLEYEKAAAHAKSVSDIVATAGYLIRYSLIDFLRKNYSLDAKAKNHNPRIQSENTVDMTQWPTRETLEDAFTNLVSTFHQMHKAWENVPPDVRRFLQSPHDTPRM